MEANGGMVISCLFLVTLILGTPSTGVKNSSDDRHNRLVESITAIVGRGFSRSYPNHLFADTGWDFDERYKVSLRTNDNKELFSNTWISLDLTGEKIIGFPMDGNEGEFVFLLRAENNAGHVKARRIRVDVLAQSIATVHKVTMKLAYGFRDFIQSLTHRILFVSIIAEYLQQNGINTRMSDIWVTSIQTHNYAISWTLATHNTNSCSEVLTKRLPMLLANGGQPHIKLLQKLQPHFAISSLSYTSDVCSRPSQKVQQSDRKNLIIGPVLIIIIMIGLSSPIFIAYLIRRGRRKREFRRAVDVRHVYSNGVATMIIAEPERNSEVSKSHDDVSHRTLYRWSPDMRNRVPVQIPSCPPPRPTLSQSFSQCSSMESTRSNAWHGLPNNQCAESSGIQLANIVNTISQSATTLKSYFISSNEREPEVEGPTLVVNNIEDDSFSIKSEGGKILESAVKKVSSFINNSYFSAPTLIRISRSDIDEDGKSSIETRNSSFELSVMSSDQPTLSQISSGVNSLDTEAQVLTTSFSQEESTSEDLSLHGKDEEHAQQNDSNENMKATAGKAAALQKCSVSRHAARSVSNDKETNSEKDIEKREDSSPLRKNSIRGSLQRLPQVQVQDVDITDNRNGKSDLLHPWYSDQVNVRVQQNAKGTSSQYYISKVAKIDKTTQRKILQNEIIFECCYDEGFGSPSMV